MKVSCLSPLTREQGPLQQKVVLSSPPHPEGVEGGSFHTGLRGNGGGEGKDRKKGMDRRQQNGTEMAKVLYLDSKKVGMYICTSVKCYQRTGNITHTN